jgi:hypothetical protein
MIMAIPVECSEEEAKAMEIAANLHRTELTLEESGRQMIEWCRLHGLPLPGEDDAGDTKAAPAGGDSTDDMPEAEKVVNADHFPEEPTPITSHHRH